MKHLSLLLLCVLFCLSGCTSLLNRNYSSETPHVQFYGDETETDSVLRAETYQGLVSAILHLISSAEETGVIRLSDYSGAAESDLDAACLEVTQQDPLGAYAVDYIKYNVTRGLSYYEANLTIVYQRTAEEIAALVSVTGKNAIRDELKSALSEHQEKLTLRVSHLDEAETAESLSHLVQEAYYAAPISALGQPTSVIRFYPDAGTQRVVEIELQYPESAEIFHSKQRALSEQAQMIVKSFVGLPQTEQLARISLYLERLRAEDAPPTAYDALVAGRANAEGIVLAGQLLCMRCGMECLPVLGTQNGSPKLWLVVQIGKVWQHVDFSQGSATTFSDTDMWAAGYIWESSQIPACEKSL